MKKLLLFSLLLSINFGYSQTNTCSPDIVFNGSWSGGSGPNGAPNSNDIDKGVLIQSDILIRENISCACLTIESGSTLSIDNNLELRVNDQLILDGDLKLIGTSQLVQNHSQQSQVSGNGRLFIDQNNIFEDVYRYTFWSSPVKNSSSNSIYNVSSIMYDGTMPTSESSQLQSINWKSYDGTLNSLDGATTNPITIANWWVYSMYNGVSRNDWIQKLQTGLIQTGLGYLMKGTGVRQNFTFAGIPNDGEISLPTEFDKTTLTGNPYPSALDSKKFFEDNPHLTEIYFWDHSDDVGQLGHTTFSNFGYYIIRNYVTGVSGVKLITGQQSPRILDAPGRYIPVGQGFMILPNYDQPLIFRNSQRAFATKEDPSNLFIRDTESEHSILKFGFEFDYNGNRYHQQSAISFIEGNTFLDEPGYDSQVGLALSNIYFRFPQSAEDIVIAGIEEVREGLEFPIALYLEESQTIDLMVDEAFNINHSYVLIDRVTNTEYNIKDNKISLDLIAGTYIDRFFIQFRRPNQEVNPTDDLIIYSHNKEVIIKPFNDTSIQSYVIYNVLGQKVMSSSDPSYLIDETFVRVPTNNFATGVLFVNVQTDKGIFKEKLILN